jgi:putative DeoR family transcriptional regulator (stage III sporulation protein D)
MYQNKFTERIDDMVYISESKERCIILGEYLVETGSTVRAAAKKFGISKSTVHKDVTQILKRYDKGLYNDVKKILEQNKLERHLRGGEATRIKYEHLNNIK